VQANDTVPEALPAVFAATGGERHRSALRMRLKDG
jgi:hypothetical protein